MARKADEAPVDQPPKRRGRPSTGKRGTFSFRVTEGLRAKLEAESASSGRPVSEEIEMRLEASFRQTPHSAPLLSMVSGSINMLETLMGAKWTENRAVALEVKAAVTELLDRYLAKPPTTSAARLADAIMATDGFMVGDVGRAFTGVLHAIGEGKPAPIELGFPIVAALLKGHPEVRERMISQAMNDKDP